MSMFYNATTYTRGSNLLAVAASEVNNDGKPDIIVADYSTASVSVLYNAGNGVFRNYTTYSTSSAPRSVVISDVNSDGKGDIVVTNYGSGSIGILLNAGNGSFLPRTS